jgi:hypothetical protein
MILRKKVLPENITNIITKENILPNSITKVKKPAVTNKPDPQFNKKGNVYFNLS